MYDRMEPHTALPAEIVDQIIDYLHDSRESLQACALVCKSWQPRCLFHLWTTMSASPEKGAIDELSTFVVSTNHVAQRITEFSISGYRDVSFANLKAILASLTSLRTLTLGEIFISQARSFELYVTSEPVVSSLTTLRIMHCSVIEQGVDAFFRLLGLFGNIENLHLSTKQTHCGSRDIVIFEDLERLIGLVLPSHVQIANLTLQSLSPQFLAQLCHPWCRPFWDSVQGLSIQDGFASWADIKQLGKVLAAHGSQFRQMAFKTSHMLVVPPEEAHNIGHGHVFYSCSVVVRQLLLLAHRLEHLQPVPEHIRAYSCSLSGLWLMHMGALLQRTRRDSGARCVSRDAGP